MINPQDIFDTNRRNFLCGLGGSLGSVAMTTLLQDNGSDRPFPSNETPLASKPTMHPAKAKAVIMLVMEGGPSQIDTFDPKPELNRLHKTESNRPEGMATGKRFYVGSPFTFRKVGQAGIDMCDQFVHMADPEVADELCVYRGCQAESLNHPEALLQLNTGSRLGGDPALGSWATYGLGSENQNLPGFVVMTEPAAPQAGSANWSNGFLPSSFQGTTVRGQGSDLREQRSPMIDLNTESETTREAYGLNQNETRSFGKQCLMARRLVEEGVRFVQIFSGGWDSHDYLERGHASRIASVDKPIAALIKDLKQRGMLDETLIVWTGEFGRTPDNHYHGGVTTLGRDHNADSMAMWFAGGGTRRGTIVGATDELGASAVECVHPIRNVHVTMLHLLGLDDNKLRRFHGGRHKQLSQIGGQVIPELLA